MAALLRARPNHNPLLPRPFSSSSSSSPFPPPASADPAPHSRFADIRDRLNSTSASTPRGRAAPSLDDLRRSLKTFRNSDTKTAQPPSSTTATSTAAPSFYDLFINSKAASSSAPAPPSSSSPFRFGALRDSLHKPGPAAPGAKPRDWKSLLSHPQKPAAAATTVLGRERDTNKLTAKAKSGHAFLRQYTYDELGKRLLILRPAAAGKDGKEWFSLDELAARLGRLRKMDREEREKKGRLPGLATDALREALQVLEAKDQNKTNYSQSTSVLTGLSGQAFSNGFMLGEPKEDLVEKYFHPDHMSSAERMKLELQRIRDEFKMSENDCGSARVQVAQLTTKIKHLSATLHKKDKHSRKGLQEMVQRRKKYLKYLHRTDWDSYCLVLSKLGLRDVPEFKPPQYKSKSSSKTKSKRKSKRKLKV